MDLDEDAFRHDEIRPKIYGRALTPYVELLIQGATEPSKIDEREELEDGVYFLGTGSKSSWALMSLR